jgi:hypothetical protein
MLNDLQLETADRLLSGIEQIAEAVERLNALGATLRVPPIAIRFSPSPLIYGENPYSATVNRMISEEYQRRLMVQIGAEHARRAGTSLKINPQRQTAHLEREKVAA